MEITEQTEKKEQRHPCGPDAALQVRIGVTRHDSLFAPWAIRVWGAPTRRFCEGALAAATCPLWLGRVLHALLGVVVGYTQVEAGRDTAGLFPVRTTQ